MWEMDKRSSLLTILRIMSKNGQTYFEILRCEHRKFLRNIWPFFDVTYERIKLQNFLHRVLTWEPKDNISPKAITEIYFKESSDKESRCDASVCANVQFGRLIEQSPKVFWGWEIFNKSLLV